MSAQRQQEFVEEYSRKAKSTCKAFPLWLIGFYYAYLRKWGLLVVFRVFAGGLLAWAIVDVLGRPGWLEIITKTWQWVFLRI